MAVRRIHSGHSRRPLHVKAHLAHWVHDSRFWAAVAIAIISLLMILAFVYAAPQGGAPVSRPIYPYYWPYPM